MYDVTDIRALVDELNIYRNAYYNNDESPVSDEEYDRLFDRLVEMEQETGIILSDSPTITVGYEVVSELEEVEHVFPPLLSLDKSKELSDMKKFMGEQYGLVMAKMDGLTCRITYRDGKLYRAETRGNGYKGEDITHNIVVVKNVPLNINNTEEVIVDGEVIVRRDTFAQLREKFVDNKGKKYKNPRNFASGSVRLHDSSRAAERGLEFIAWKFVKGSTYKHFSSRLNELELIGFVSAPFTELTPSMRVQEYQVVVDLLKEQCETLHYPIDGCVFSYNVCEYMESLGYTSHHSKAQIAFKFYDDKYDTVIRDIDWTMGKTGALTPTAIFDTVEIDGTDVSRASLHNLTIMKQLNVRKDCTARVFKANMIIPQVDSVDNDGIADFDIPTTCPICGGKTSKIQENDSEVLMCMNDNCSGKLLGKLCTFVSKQGMDIDGLGENNLELFIQLGLISRFSDIYNLHEYYNTLVNLEGKGKASIDKLLSSIENSKNVTFENFISALSIPNVGLTTAKAIAKHFDYNIELFTENVSDGFDFTQIDGFGEKTSWAINKWFNDNWSQYKLLLEIVTVEKSVQKHSVVSDSPISGKTFCITGTFWESRSVIQSRLEALGGVPVSSVTKKTDILFVGEKAGSKLKKAQELNILIYDEQATQRLLEEYSL